MSGFFTNYVIFYIIHYLIIVETTCAFDHIPIDNEIFLKFHVEGEGFHQNLRLSGYSSTNRSSCHLLIKWTIPSGIYADPYQLQPFIDNQTLRFADGVNIESMEHHSPEIVFYTNEKLDCQNVCRFSKSIPIHVRYHLPNRRQASNDLSALVNLVPPSIYSSCGNGKHCFDENEPSCNWERMKSSPIDGEQRTHISIPVGDLSHSVIVAFMTLLTTSVGTICVAKEV